MAGWCMSRVPRGEGMVRKTWSCDWSVKAWKGFHSFFHPFIHSTRTRGCREATINHSMPQHRRTPPFLPNWHRPQPPPTSPPRLGIHIKDFHWYNQNGRYSFWIECVSHAISLPAHCLLKYSEKIRKTHVITSMIFFITINVPRCCTKIIFP